MLRKETPPPLIQFIYSAEDLGNIQFKLKNKTIKDIRYQSGYQKRGLQSSFSLTQCGSLQSPYVNPEGFVLTRLFDKISLRTMKISLENYKEFCCECAISFEEAFPLYESLGNKSRSLKL